MSYNIGNLVFDLDGHEHESDRKIKIKLADGTIKEIEGFEFRNACIGGDDIIYIKELNPMKEAWGKGITDFVRLADKLMEICENEYEAITLNDDDDADPCDILHMENEIAKIADFYIQKCNLEKYVEERYGYYEPGAGDTDEVYAKIGVLKNFMNL